ncbi:MAG: tRNA uridine-5-carboxymethylaminomethyl(34) synthesis GTPase MnmE [Candidatus Stahlbacteria bacterium]|nr:MAG: tRNA uridine-5-carboxymethylaminomethyl(34) synthesis GTPase MnmE [Candidatus Stahlbacteria bacterium]
MLLERLQDVIVAPATPGGRSALAIVRVSGPKTLRMCDQIFKGRKRLIGARGHQLLNGFIVEGEEIVDEALAAVYRAPHSYTTEDTVEFSLHGNPLIVERVTDLLIGIGARLARPGEFTERAFLHGRLDVTQAEAVLATIEARTLKGIKAALAQLRGDLAKELEGLSDRVRWLLTLLQAQLEFPEEDIQEESLEPMLEELIADTKRLERAFRRGRSQRKGLAVMILGRPNVGKSTLFNALLGEERSIVTPVPGTTRDLVTGTLRLPTGQVRLFDGAGIGIAESLPDQCAVRRAIGAVNRADFLLVILDATSGFVPADAELLKLLRKKPGMIVWNKTDAVKEVPSLENVSGEPIGISALKRKNLSPLLDRLKEEASSQGETFFANRFQEERLEHLAVHLRSALDAQYLDMRAKELREALADVTGTDRSALDQRILEEIFSRFCVGK